MTTAAPTTPLPTDPTGGPRLRLLRYEPEPGPGARSTLRATPVHGLPPPTTERPRDTAALRRRVEHVLRSTLEVLDGRRPLAHLDPHLEASALRYVRTAQARRRTARQSLRLTSVHVSRPCAQAAEVAAVYRSGGRAHALAARFEGPAGSVDGDPRRWRCVTLRLL
jgi:hypothetical protein